MIANYPHTDRYESRRLRLMTLTRLRWVAIAGQSLAVLFVAYAMGYPMPVSLCFGLIALSAWLNLFLTFRYPPATRLNPTAGFGILAFDVLQLSGLLYLTGGISNPFALLVIVPPVVAATSLPWRLTLLLSGLVLASVSLLFVFHLPLPWVEGANLAIPPMLKAGFYTAILAALAFTVLYARRVAVEASQLADALAATELVLQREQHLSALDGLAAATAHELGTPLATIALVARELQLALKDNKAAAEDIDLIVSQAKRCREILQRLSSLSAEGEEHLARLPLTSLIEEVCAPHRDFGIEIHVAQGRHEGAEPVGKRNAGIMHALGNLVENAVDFANNAVTITHAWNGERVSLIIEDDGPGFSPAALSRIGDPYNSVRDETSRTSGGGLGLGLFIAKTLLERSGANLTFTNRSEPGSGAHILIEWPRSRMEIGSET